MERCMLAGTGWGSFATDACPTELHLGLYVLLASGAVSLANEINIYCIVMFVTTEARCNLCLPR